MSLFAILFSRLQTHRSATPVPIASSRFAPEGWRSMRVSGRLCFSLAVRSIRFLSGAQSPLAARLRQAFVGAPFRLVPVPTQPAVSVFTSPFVHQNTTEKTVPSSTAWANLALNLASSRFEVCASLLALGRGHISRILPIARLVRWARCAPVSVGLLQSRFGARSINPSSPGSANPSVKRRLSEHSTPRGAPYFHVGYQFAVSGRKSAQTFNNLIEVSIQ